MKNLSASLFVAASLTAGLLAFTPPASAQQVSLTSTTITAAVAPTDKRVCLASATGVVVPTGSNVGSLLFINQEPMHVRMADSTALCYVVVRSTHPVGHASGDTVYLSAPQNFRNSDPAGTCVLGSIEVRPWINLTNAKVSDCVNSRWVAINGPYASTTGVTGLTPNAAGTVDSATALLPWRNVYFSGTSGTPATNNFKFTGASTSGTRTVTFPDGDITVPGTVAQDCGTAAGACAATNKSATLKIVRGTAAATSGTPSTVSITGMSPAFTSAATYTCTASNATTAANVFSVLTAGYVSGSAVTFTGPNTLTDTIRYYCIGY